MAEKDAWNAHRPKYDKNYAKFVNHPELARLLPVLYPGVFPNLAAYHKPRADLNAILLTGIPTGVVPGLPELHRAGRGGHAAPQPRHPAGLAAPRPLGLVAGDPAGFPNGRRVDDDVVTIELRAVAGIDDPAGRPVVHRRTARRAWSRTGRPTPTPPTTDTFPYLGNPGGGYQTQPGSAAV